MWWTWSAVKEGSVLHRGARTWSLVLGERWGRSPQASRGAPPRTTTLGVRWRSMHGCRLESGLSRLVPWPVTLQKLEVLTGYILPCLWPKYLDTLQETDEASFCSVHFLNTSCTYDLWLEARCKTKFGKWRILTVMFSRWGIRLNPYILLEKCLIFNVTWCRLTPNPNVNQKNKSKQAKN